MGRPGRVHLEHRVSTRHRIMEQGKLDIRLLGTLEVCRNDTPLSLPRSKKTRALLGYLVATERPHSRQKLCDLLFEGPADPRAALRWSLSKLRPLVDDDRATRLVSDRDKIRFEPHGATVDLMLIRGEVAPDPAEASTEVLQKAASRFRGDLLEGLDLSACYRFDAWCTAEREAVHVLRDTILRVLIDRLRDEPEAALPYARDRLLIDPLSEDAHIDLMRLLGTMGRKDEALEQYDRCRQMLEVEFDARPSREMEEVRRSLTRAQPTPASSSPRTTPDRSVLPPLVGRRDERTVLKRFIDQGNAGASGEVLLLTGAPGIGKTRLLEEFGSQVENAGGTVLPGRAFDVERVRPYTAWIDALRAVTTEQIPRELRPELAALLPELGPASEDVTDRNRLFDAVLRLLGSLALQAPPVCVLLDDLHWFDEASVALLHYVARATAGQNVLLACAARSAELEDNAAARRLIHTLRRDGRLCRVDLAPLSASDTGQLVQQVDPELDAERIFSESEGNPLFALEVARALQQGKGLLSDTLDGLITERLIVLDPQAQDIIPWAAALGRGFTLELLSGLTGASSLELVDAAEELCRHGLFQVTSSGGYDFTHDLVRRAVYRNTSAPRRRLIHLQIARALAGPHDLDEAKAGEVAHHAILAGDRELAARACAAAGRHSLRVFAYEEAAVLAERGLEHLDGLSREMRMPLHFELLALYVDPSMRRFRPPDLEDRLHRLTEAAQAAGRPELESRGFDLFGWLYYHRGDFSGAAEATLDVHEAGAEADPATVVRALAVRSHCLCLLEQEMERAEKLALEARALADEFDLRVDRFEFPMALGMLRRHSGALDEAQAFVERALQCSRRDPLPWAQYHCLSHLVMIELERERPEEALIRCQELRPMAMKVEEGSDRPFAAALEALARLALGENGARSDLDEAVAQLYLTDSKWMIAYVENAAAAHDLDDGNPQAARRRAEEALAAAEPIQRPSEIALARARLARAAVQEEKWSVAMRHLKAVRGDLERPGVLSARARSAVEHAERQLAEHREPIIKN